MPLRLVVLLLLIGFTIWLAVSSVLKHRKIPKSRMISLLVLAVIIGQQGWMEYQWQQTEKVMAQAVEPITGPGINVHCQRFVEALVFTRNNLGEVKFGDNGKPERATTITWDTCRTFRGFVNSDHMNPPTPDQIESVHVLTHEAVHMSGEKAESATECYAMQLMPWVAESFGVSRDMANGMSQYYWENVYPHMPMEYRSTECAPGGGMDLDPGTDEWPRATNIPVTFP